MNQNLPAKKVVTQMPVKSLVKPYRAFDEFVKQAQMLVSTYRALDSAVHDIYPHCPSERLPKAETLLESYDRSDRKRIERFEGACREFNPDEAYDEDYQITKAQVSKHVSLLVGSFPNANPADPEVYTKMLIEEIMAAEPSVVSLESACRSIRRSAKFLPTISEVLEALKEESKTWTKCWEAIECIDEAAEELRQKLATEKERRAAQEDEKRKTAPLFSVGDRVKHQKFGTGTVSFVDGNKCVVNFDQRDKSVAVVDSFLEHPRHFEGAT
jgi:vacuolar-type H+-ATPase subunit I/STV1